MDPLTHSLLGASCAMAVAPRGHIRMAALIGATAGLLPDADIFIRSQENPLFFIQYHRHFTHAFVLQPVIAALACLMVWAVTSWKSELGLKRWLQTFYPCALVAALSHPICDAWTSYGTHVFWPFTDARTAWNLTSVIDPLFTFLLFAGVVTACFRATRGAALWGLLAAACYLGLAATQQARATQAYRQVIESRGHMTERLVVRPSFGNTLLWRGTYESDGIFHIDAIRAGWGEPTVIEGTQVARLRPQEGLPGMDTGSTQYRDLLIFEHFSDGWIAWHPDKPQVVGDIRYATLPDSLAPLWGIRLNPQNPDSHVEWLTFRQMNADKRQTFWRMIWD